MPESRTLRVDVTPGGSLKQALAAFRAANPMAGLRAARFALGVSEAELVATGCDESVTRLACNWPALVAELPALGPVTASTHNSHARHEKYGAYGNLHLMGSTAIVLNPGVGLWHFFDEWLCAFAVHDERRPSLQFFGRDGSAVHRLFLEPGSNRDAFDALVNHHAAADQGPDQTLDRGPRPFDELLDGPIDLASFRAAWASLEDPYDFVELLRTFRVSHQQALRLAGPTFAYRVQRTSLQRVLASVAADSTPIMIFVGNQGSIQIHTGAVYRTLTKGPWLTIRDPSFGLQLRADRIVSAWVVRKPTRDGVVTSLDLFDPSGTPVAQLYGARRPGQAEQPRWRALVARLGRLQTASGRDSTRRAV